MDATLVNGWRRVPKPISHPKLVEGACAPASAILVTSVSPVEFVLVICKGEDSALEWCIFPSEVVC